MSDKDFDFRPRERREPRRFEPPPWEQDSFEELARQRAEREAAEQQAAAAAQVARVAAEAPEAEAPEAERDVELEAALADLAQPDAPEPRPELDEAAVTAMLAELKEEVGVDEPAVWKFSIAVGAGLVIFGSVLIVWGMAGLRAGAGKAVGNLMTAVMLLFGAGFVVGGLYMAARTLRQRGVL